MVLVLGVGLYTIKENIKPSPLMEVNDFKGWDEEVIKEAQSIPVQDGGRIKPFEKWASVNMLAFHGDRSMKILVNGEKRKIKPTEWMLTVIFRPEMADKLPIFRIDNSDILTQIGLKAKERRDRYSYNELKPALAKLDQIAQRIQKKAQFEEPLTRDEKQLRDLRNNIGSYFSLKNPAYGGKENPDHTALVFVDNSFLKEYAEAELNTDEEKQVWLEKVVTGLIAKRDLVEQYERSSHSKLTWIPAKDLNEKEWNSFIKKHHEGNHQKQVGILDYIFENLEKRFTRDGKPAPLTLDQKCNFTKLLLNNAVPHWPAVDPEVVAEKDEFLALHTAMDSGDASKQVAAFKAFKEKYAPLMAERGEGKQIKSEMMLDRINYFINAIVFLLFAFLFITVYCVSPQGRWGKIGYKVAFVCATIAMLLVVAGVTHRSLIMGRPPIGTLFDTMPFIVGTAMLVLLGVERLSKRGILLGLSIVLGLLGLFLARRYELGDGKDQLDPLRAVLDSNFWLATHVITITIGYMGGLVAAGVSHVYIIGRMFGIFEDAKTPRYLTRTAYGLIAFTLVFSLIGTVLGGIWAADSWGRFWGWDPKENGALLIVIWCLVILHARAGGHIKQLGLHICTVFGAVIVAFSWWHVNFLEMGLHSYGFTDGDGKNFLWGFYIMEAIIMICGASIFFNEYEQKRMKELMAAEAASLASADGEPAPPADEQPSTEDQSSDDTSTDTPKDKG